MNRLLEAFILCLITIHFLIPLAAAQSVKAPDEEEIFEEDVKDAKRAKEGQVKSALGVDAPGTDNLDFKAPNVEFLKEKNIVKGSGGAVISQSGTISQSDRAEVNLTTKDSELHGKVVVNTSTASLAAEDSRFNFDTEAGEFDKATVQLEEGGYQAEAEKLNKLSETKYSLFDSMFTTCHCADGKKPWKINSESSNITQEGYAHCYNNTIEFQGVPLIYTPYLAFPVKTERQSGLLVPEYGYSSRDGILYKQPVFLVLDDSSDATVSPFTESRTRNGSQLDFRQYFSKRSKIDSRLIYSNESPRDGDLRGVNQDGLFDKTIQTNRFLGYYNQRWQNDQDADIPLQFLSNLHFTNDDLAVREFDDEKIAEGNARYLTSQMVFRASLTDYLNTSLEGEYNQFIDQDDELGFQRLPELNITELKSFRPFGYNSLGARVVTRTQVSVTDFVRDKGYDGVRTNVVPNISLPFHYQNYLASEAGVGMRYTTYNLNNNMNPDPSVSEDLAELDDSSDREVYNAYYGISTAVENVYGLDDDSWLVYLTSLGKENQQNRLRRVKHTVEPFVKYNFVPPTAQDDLPFFDSTDRIRDKSIFTYGFTSNLYGRFLPLAGSTEKITELTPKIEDLPDLNNISAITDVGSLDNYTGLGGAVSSRNGDISNLATLSMKQVYDYQEDKKDEDPARSPYSDVDSELTLYPSQDFALSVQNFYNAEDHDTSYWALASHLRDDRGDSLKARYTFKDDDPKVSPPSAQVGQVEGNLELVLDEQLRFGYYAHYDMEQSEIIRERMALRVVSACNCWHFDLGYGKKENPDKEYVFLSFTLTGLGDISQKFGLTNTNGQ
jgi:LPS-assembly protein